MNKIKYKKAIASVLECSSNNVFLYWKGRVALFAILKAMGIGKNDEIILPGFTCVVVPNAIIYTGAKPVYVDITSEDYNMNFDLIEKAITNKTKVIICQNTFGLSSNIEQIVSLAKKYNLFTIEDCTHGFSGYYNGKPNGSYCDAAFYSTQWNKPFSTGIGGFLIVNNNNLLTKVNELEKLKKKSSFFEKAVLSSLLTFKNILLNKYTHWFLVNVYRIFSKKNIVVGSNQGQELSGTEMPEDYFKDISSVQVFAGLKNLKKLEHINELRKKNAKDYTDFLKNNNKTFVKEKYFKNHLFLKYPLIVKNREVFFELAQNQNITLGDWFLSPIHPIKKEFTKWDFEEKQFPVAVSLSKKMVNLPTDIPDNKKVIEFLAKFIDQIE